MVMPFVATPVTCESVNVLFDGIGLQSLCPLSAVHHFVPDSTRSLSGRLRSQMNSEPRSLLDAKVIVMKLAERRVQAGICIEHQTWVPDEVNSLRNYPHQGLNDIYRTGKQLRCPKQGEWTTPGLRMG